VESVKALLTTFFVSMLPVIELRGGIPFGVGLGLTVWQAFGAALLGNIIIGLVIIALLKPILSLLQETKTFNRVSARISAKFETRAGKIKQSNKFWGIVAFVGVPFPLTGVWTGAAVAVFLGLSFPAAAAACTAGVIISGFIILGITMLFPQYTAAIFNAFLICAVILTAAFLIYVFQKPKPIQKTDTGAPPAV
jgi:uncharacterized membrane protein